MTEEEYPLEHALMDAFDEAYLQDSDAAKGFRKLIYTYETANDALREVIDDTLINLCGYSLNTLIDQAKAIVKDKSKGSSD
jgi:hypothetical protein